MALEESARWVLGQFLPAGVCRELARLGNAGGFSGAALWRAGTAAGDLCLRAWPAGMTADALTQIHRLMLLARQSHCDFVPAVGMTARAATSVERDGRLWDLTEWRPGRADFHDQPSAERLRAACTALARLHEVWSRQRTGPARCPAIIRRLDRLQRWDSLVRGGWRPDWSQQSVVLAALGRNAGNLLACHLPGLPKALRRWRTVDVPLSPCLCDIWHDHVLYVGDAVSGIIDYGSVKLDHVAVDLARLLGSLVGDDEHHWQIGLQAYRQLRPLSGAEEELARVLDRSGTLLALANWLVWLFHDGRRYDDADAVARRLTALVQRVAAWPRLD